MKLTAPLDGMQCAAVSIALGPISAAVQDALPRGVWKTAKNDADQSAVVATLPFRNIGSFGAGSWCKANAGRKTTPSGGGSWRAMLESSALETSADAFSESVSLVD